MKKIYLLLILLFVPMFFISCEKEEMNSAPELAPATTRAVEKIPYEELPAHISNYLSDVKNTHLKKGEPRNPFGEIKTNLPVVKITN